MDVLVSDTSVVIDLERAQLIERIFALPGMGRLMIESVGSRDYLVVQGGVLVVGAGFVVANALTDLARSLVDPRVRIESNGG